MTFFVQWWLIRPAGKSTSLVPEVVIAVSPPAYGKRITASELATYRSWPTSAIPKGELNPARNTECKSATPSPSVSRSKVIRFAEGTAAPAFLYPRLTNQPFKPLASSGLGGALVSATSTSPFGSTKSHRGWSSPEANAATRVPGAAIGLPPTGQPFAAATLTVGISDWLGAGNVGVGPNPAEAGRRAGAAQPIAASVKAVASPRAGFNRGNAVIHV